MQSPPHSVWPASPPPPRRAGVRPGNGRRRLSSSLAATVVVIALTSAALVLQRHDGTRQGSMIEQLDTLAWQLGLGLDQVEATGMRFTSDAAILDAVDMPNVRSFLSLDAAAVKRRIERLAWIDTARIERRLPNVLAIEVTERKPFAVWERGARDLLVDQGGRQLAAVARGAAPGLPRLVGERAPDDAGRLLDLVAQYPDVAERLQVAERVGGRRWRLHLRDAPRIELPAEADAMALAMLVEPRPGGRLIDVAAAVIDLTVLRRVTISPAPSSKQGS